MSRQLELMEPLARSLSIKGPLDLRATLRPLHGMFASDGWWLAARTPVGDGSLRIRRASEDLIGDAWGPGAGWLLARLGSIAGLHDDPSAFRIDHPIVGELHRRHPGWRFGRSDLVVDALVTAIVEQRVTSHEARAAMRGLRAGFGDRAPGPNRSLILPPDPVRIAAAPYWVFHELHLEKRRADALRRVTGMARVLDDLREASSTEASEVLLAVPGVGPWTVSKTLAVSHGDPDQVDVGDFHLKHMVVHHLTGRDRGTDDEMLELLEPFRPHRGRVARLIHNMGHAPKFGPRMPLRDITGM